MICCCLANEKKRSERRKQCVLAVVRRSQKFCPTTDPFPGARDDQNSISWRWSLPLPTNPVWWGSRHAILSYRGNRPTHTHTNPQTGPNTIHLCCSFASAHCNDTLSPPLGRLLLKFASAKTICCWLSTICSVSQAAPKCSLVWQSTKKPQQLFTMLSIHYCLRVNLSMRQKISHSGQ